MYQKTTYKNVDNLRPALIVKKKICVCNFSNLSFKNDMATQKR